MEKTLEFKWTTSRGRDTYGYNICSLYVDGIKEASCNGGGYDMEGTAFADYLVSEYQDRLLDIKDYARNFYNSDDQKAQRINDKGLYGMTHYTVENKIHIDGACGFSSVQKIADEIGITLKYLRTAKNDGSLYLLEDRAY